MPQDNRDDKAPTVGRTYRNELASPITTPEIVAARLDRASEHAAKPGAVSIQVYFVTRGIDNIILQASMLAYTEIRTAPIEVFDDIFDNHHEDKR